jgi:hypothetical protein
MDKNPICLDNEKVSSMKKDTLRINDIIFRFKSEESFSTQQLYAFYLEEEPALNEGTFRWRTYHLKRQGIIRSVKRGLYVLESRKVFEPIISGKLTRVFNLIKRQLPYTDILVWEAEWLHAFMIHQPVSSMLIVEVEKEAIHTVFELLREKRLDVYIYSRKVDNDYYLSSNSIIIKPFLREAPEMKINKIVVPKIEKILVDLFVEKGLMVSYQGQELINIYNNVFKQFSVNTTTLLRYARHRNIKERITEFLFREIQIDSQYI